MKLRLLAVVAVCCALIAVAWREGSGSAAIGLSDRPPMPPAVATPADQCRPEEQTFLTIPEWFLVFSPKEYAEDVQRRPPSSFPFFDHIVQFWRGYRAVVRATENYPVNWGYHLMVVVIGVSTTVEYGMKGVYESTLGRLTEATCPHGATQEDRLAASVGANTPTFSTSTRGTISTISTRCAAFGRKPGGGERIRSANGNGNTQ